MGENDHHRLLFLLLLDFLRCPFALLFLDIYVELLAQYAAGFREVRLLMFHDEVDGITTFPAYKAVTDILRGADNKRRVLIVVEGTLPYVVDPAFLQGHIFINHTDDGLAVELVNNIVLNHSYSVLTLQKYYLEGSP